MTAFEQELTNTFNKYNITLNSRQAEQFELYYRMLLLWNEKFNLTTITNQTDVIIKHFLDSVVGVYDELEQDAQIIDIGTGAGFPAIPLKIMREDLGLCLVDSLQKRTVFLKEVVHSLELENVLVLHARAEDLAHLPIHRESYDYAVSRAVAKCNTLLEYCVPFVKIGGYVVAYKAKGVEDEIAQATNAMAVLQVQLSKQKKLIIEETESERTLLWFKKNKATGTTYPRSQNKAKANPL